MKLSKSIVSEIKTGLLELFSILEVQRIQVEDSLSVGIESFIKDLVKMIDEVNTPEDIARMWHIDGNLAQWIYSTMSEILFSKEDNSEGSLTSDEEDSDDLRDGFDKSDSSDAECVDFDQLCIYDN